MARRAPSACQSFLMEITRALAYYRTNYLMGVARPGALSFDGTTLVLQANDLSVVWSAPLSAVKVKKGMGILTVSINGDKASILTAVGSGTAAAPSTELKALLESGAGLEEAPSVDAATRASSMNRLGVAAYAQGQKALRGFFETLGVMA